MSAFEKLTPELTCLKPTRTWQNELKHHTMILQKKQLALGPVERIVMHYRALIFHSDCIPYITYLKAIYVFTLHGQPLTFPLERILFRIFYNNTHL